MSVYAHVEDNAITGVYHTLPQNWKNVTNLHLLDDVQLLRNLGWRTISIEKPDYDSSTQVLSGPNYSIQDDEVIESYTVTDIVKEEIPTISSEVQAIIKYEQHINAIDELRNMRNTLLAQTDYTQLADVKAKQSEQLANEYVTYRQALRDLLNIYESNPDFTSIHNVTWPTKPESI